MEILNNEIVINVAITLWSLKFIDVLFAQGNIWATAILRSRGLEG